MNLAEPNSTLEQTSLNAVGRDIVPELGLREVKIVFQLCRSNVRVNNCVWSFIESFAPKNHSSHP